MSFPWDFCLGVVLGSCLGAFVVAILKMSEDLDSVSAGSVDMAIRHTEWRERGRHSERERLGLRRH